MSAVGSTNDIALSLASSGAPAGVVVIAETQTAGRGRRGRTWFSPPESGLYVSIVLKPSTRRATGLLTLAIGVALAEGIQAATGLAPDIKWPNDLIVGRRKLAGILTESIARPERAGDPMAAVVTGFGINVGPMAYPPDLADRATSLETELGRPIERAVLLVEALAAVAARYADLVGERFDAILGEWRARAPGCRGAAVRWSTASGSQTGTTAGLADDGALLVDMSGRVERIVGGEVVWI